MAHKAEVVAQKQLSDGALAICVRCCDDPLTDSWHTVYDLENVDDAAMDNEIAMHVNNVEKKHAGMERVKQHIQKISKKIP